MAEPAGSVLLIGLGVQAVADFAVALEALYFALAYVPVVNEIGVGELFHFLRLTVAVAADLFSHFTVALNSVKVAFPASDVAVEVRLMVEAFPAGEFDRFGGGLVTGGAIGNGVFLPPVYTALEVAKEADRFGDGDMRALDHLRMAGSAAEFLAPAQLGEVGCVVEFVFTLEGSLASEQPGFMTALPEAGSVLYFSVRFRAMGSGKSLNRFGSGGNFASQNILPARRKMTILASHRVMARASPTGNIRFHKMARIAEPRGVAVKKEKPTKGSYKRKDDQQYDNTEAAG